MPIIILIVLIIIVAALIWATFNLLGLILMLIMAGIVGWLADLIVPGRLPYGWLGNILAGLVGSWLGALLFGRLGPTIFGISIISALLGTIIVAFVVALVTRSVGPRRRAF